ncbi:MAG: aspartate--tRNA ligase [Candidatus Marinimicrobia bacterium]|nr:aspartate--tRNA ligase [Candidatus Neomarinimicrobiota bacterium]|tara:strand:- start:8780 stop:10543 length:1764 start_codon:yes stop_codon:yes gene_type:complete
MIKRTHTCGEINLSQLNQIVSLNGWISKRRDLGSLIFFDLRDRYGITQIVFDSSKNIEIFNIAKKLSFEDVIGIEGLVIKRPKEAINNNMTTGEIDVQVENLLVYNESKPTPFDINNRESASEEHRLKYRYLELRTKEMQNFMSVRHKAALTTRQFLSDLNFIEIETPVLMKSTPEGARDFLVPSRLHHGKFYALPQSPQTYKQLLMVSGFDRYFQIVKCFRDEDFRADRQPEFTQIDIEMSFVTQDDIINMGTNLTRDLWKKVINVDLPKEFPQLTYKDAMENYGSDKPDIRFDMQLLEFSDYVESSDFSTFKSILKCNGRVKAIKCPNADYYSRKKIDELTDWLKKYYHAKGLAWMKCSDSQLDGGISKFFNDKLKHKMIADLSIKNNEILFIIGDDKKVTLNSLGALRLEIAKQQNLIDQSQWAPVWIVDFPLVEYNEDLNRWDALHHPFTSPNFEDINLLKTDPGAVRSLGYDIVMNGYELGGGSIRIHDSNLQSEIFKLLGIESDEAKEKFGFLMNAFQYGAPPHGGMAFGFDRIIMLLAGSNQIRDVIAFPKTTSAISLMDNSPSLVDEAQLNELGLKLKK